MLKRNVYGWIRYGNFYVIIIIAPFATNRAM